MKSVWHHTKEKTRMMHIGYVLIALDVLIVKLARITYLFVESVTKQYT